MPLTAQAVQCSEPAPDRRLAIVRLQVANFRCYREADISVDGRPVVLTGPNGAGKTNLLEALSFLAPGRGLRRARLGEIDRRAASAAPSGASAVAAPLGAGAVVAPLGASAVAAPIGAWAVSAPLGAWAVSARLATPQGEVQVGTGRDPETASEAARDRRLIRIDGVAIKGQAALAELLSLVWLTPQMDRLFQEGPSQRRRFLDRLVYAGDPAHAARVAAFEQAMRERQRLLEEGGTRADPAWLDALEGVMAAEGVAISAARRALVGRLDQAAVAAPEGPFPRPRLELEGAVESWLAEAPALAAEERLAGLLRGSRLAGAHAPGPHRSDMRVSHRGTGMPAELGSTGEQKALLVAIVLAHASLEAADRGTAPVLLLDEIAAHLDRPRREALFETILDLGAQAWLTGTDEALFRPLGADAQFLKVENAVVIR